jgi:hypothetical protein
VCVGLLLDTPAWEGEINARIVKEWALWSCVDCGYQEGEMSGLVKGTVLKNLNLVLLSELFSL